MGLAEKIRSHPEELEHLFVGGPKALELQDLVDLFVVCYEEPGSNRRREENQTMMFWNDWLIEVDGMTLKIVFVCVFFQKFE